MNNTSTLESRFDLSPLTIDQCRFFADLAQKVSRIRIDPSREDFLRFRLSRRLRALDLKDFAAYEALLRSESKGRELRNFIEAITTHTTSFFRESHQYEWLQNSGLQQICKKGVGIDRPLVVWSAACSTGAELWSAAFILQDTVETARGFRRYQLFGTDISKAILKKAESATYLGDEIKGVSTEHLSKYFLKSKSAIDAQGSYLFRIVPEIRKNATFGYTNLTERTALPDIGADIVFLRNILIYFNAAMQQQAIDNVVSKMRTGGALLTGHSETIPSHPKLRSVGPSIYLKL